MKTASSVKGSHACSGAGVGDPDVDRTELLRRRIGDRTHPGFGGQVCAHTKSVHLFRNGSSRVIVNVGHDDPGRPTPADLLRQAGAEPRPTAGDHCNTSGKPHNATPRQVPYLTSPSNTIDFAQLQIPAKMIQLTEQTEECYMNSENVEPEHDPLSEEMDLITFQEADARLYKEQARTRALIEKLESALDPDPEESSAQRSRLEALGRVEARLRAQRTQPPLR
ncbi:hypothetical protein [Mycolicibacterium sp. XJ1819]